MIESLFKNCIKAAQDLNMDKSKIKQWKHVISHLWAPPILDVPEKGKVFGLAFTENNEVYPDAKTNIQGYHFDAHTTAVFPAGVLAIRFFQEYALFQKEIKECNETLKKQKKQKIL